MTNTARVAPTGDQLVDGYPTLIAFAADPDIKLWEQSVQMPGQDIGDKIRITSMHNDRYETFAPPSLVTLTDGSFVCGYDPAALTQIEAILGVNGWITVHLPNGDRYSFVGYLRSAIPQNKEISQQPTMNCVFCPTNQLLGVETDPIFTAGT